MPSGDHGSKYRAEVIGLGRQDWFSEPQSCFRSAHLICGTAHLLCLDANSWFGLVAEVGGGYTTNSQRISINRTVDVTSKVHAFMGGVRLNARIAPRIVLVHPVLVGGAHASVNTEAVGVTLSPSDTKLALQPGLGINLMVTDKIGIRVAGDYRRARLCEKSP